MWRSLHIVYLCFYMVYTPNIAWIDVLVKEFLARVPVQCDRPEFKKTVSSYGKTVFLSCVIFCYSSHVNVRTAVWPLPGSLWYPSIKFTRKSSVRSLQSTISTHSSHVLFPVSVMSVFKYRYLLYPGNGTIRRIPQIRWYCKEDTYPLPYESSFFLIANICSVF